MYLLCVNLPVLVLEVAHVLELLQDDVVLAGRGVRVLEVRDDAGGDGGDFLAVAADLPLQRVPQSLETSLRVTR